MLAFRLQRKLAHRCGLRLLTREKQFSRFDRSLRSRSRGIGHRFARFARAPRPRLASPSATGSGLQFLTHHKQL
ncbi:MAG: hypothetical protein A2131_00470 [Candidatus Sungbacteria bacterium GWC2_49_10]|uniref:Uncharacterized protein n=1 Tax=Candidatus Sungbacteria bacterium GWC2_49_10 TaxID=1802263 RepID=A0A1G2K1B0_9BACT|nr:MAG: hypothetical protein A2131_00470 [Candidatus Sungbacteria bacterium GWC2_49_10]